jgi:hypothetical protein
MTKAEWLEEGKALGARASESGWELGKWLVQGEEQFIGPVPSSKKAASSAESVGGLGFGESS